MSVVIYDAKSQVMAADTRAYSGSAHPIGNKMKIHRIATGRFEGSLLGVTSSTPGMAEEFKHWIENDALRSDTLVPAGPDFEALLVMPDGSVHLYLDAYYSSGPLVGDVFTIGSGKKYALGAFKAGASVVGAVEAAIECDTMCGGPVALLQLHKDEAHEERPEQLTLDIAAFSTGATLSPALS